MVIDFSMFLPPALNNYKGRNIAVWFLILINTMGSIRSLIHMFARDGGAQSIATMNLEVAGGKNIVAIFGQWGGVQLIIALTTWIVLWRYREFIPLMIAEVIIEQLIRIIVGLLKPAVTDRTPPGRTGTHLLLPLSGLMLILSLIRD